MLRRQKGDSADAHTSKTTTSPSAKEAAAAVFHNEDELILTGKFAHRVQSIIVLTKALFIIIAGYCMLPEQLWWAMLVPAMIFCVLHLLAFQLLGTSRRYSQALLSLMLVSPFVLTLMCLAMPSEEFIAAHDEAQDGPTTMAILFFAGVSFSVNQRSLRWKLLNGAAFVGLSLAGELLLEQVHAYKSFTRFYVLHAHVPFVVGTAFGHLIAYTLVEQISPLHGQLREALRRYRELERAASASAVSALTPLSPTPTFGDSDATSHASCSASSASASSVLKDRVSDDAACGGNNAAEEPTLTDVTVETHEDDGLVGEGAFATVHVGRWLGSKVAIKVPRKDRPSLELEAKTLTRLRHPCVCAFIGTVLHRGRLAIVMEYLEGGSLNAFLQLDKAAHQRRPIVLSMRMRIAREAASGLAFLHERRYVHRDVKPENILLTGDYHAKIADFGITSGHENSGSKGTSNRACPRLGSAALVWTNTARIGTPRYMAPEVMMIDEKAEGALQVKPELPGAAQRDGDHTGQSLWTSKVPPNWAPASEQAGTDDIDDSAAKMKARYGTPCDVYSFGLTLHEIMYQQRVMEDLRTAHFLYSFVFQQKRPALPPRPIYRSGDAQVKKQSFGGDINVDLDEANALIVEILISSCWQHSADARPSMTSVIDSLVSVETSLELATRAESRKYDGAQNRTEPATTQSEPTRWQPQRLQTALKAMSIFKRRRVQRSVQ